MPESYAVSDHTQVTTSQSQNIFLPFLRSIHASATIKQYEAFKGLFGFGFGEFFKSILETNN